MVAELSIEGLLKKPGKAFQAEGVGCPEGAVRDGGGGREGEREDKDEHKLCFLLINRNSS